MRLLDRSETTILKIMINKKTFCYNNIFTNKKHKTINDVITKRYKRNRSNYRLNMLDFII